MEVASMQQTAQALRQGAPAIFPTDTVYGLGVAVEYAESPEALYALKGREARKPIAWLVGGVEALDAYGCSVPAYAYAAARTFWPGPLTLVVKASEAVPAAYASAEGTIGLRMPASETALKLIEAVGCPLSTTSANPSGAPAPYNVASVDEALAAQVGAVLADSAAKSGVASTIVDCTGPAPRILREGGVSAAQMSQICSMAF